MTRTHIGRAIYTNRSPRPDGAPRGLVSSRAVPGEAVEMKKLLNERPLPELFEYRRSGRVHIRASEGLALGGRCQVDHWEVLLDRGRSGRFPRGQPQNRLGEHLPISSAQRRLARHSTTRGAPSDKRECRHRKRRLDRVRSDHSFRSPDWRRCGWWRKNRGSRADAQPRGPLSPGWPPRREPQKRRADPAFRPVPRGRPGPRKASPNSL